MKAMGFVKGQQGSSLLEALVAIVIFSIGLLALISLQAASIKTSIDAKYRSDAAYLANQIIAQMWVDRSNIGSYGHYQTTSPPQICPGLSPGGTASSYAKFTSWLSQVTGLLPGSGSNKMQIQVSDVGTTKQVKVTVCWQGPQETTSHNFVVTAQINP